MLKLIGQIIIVAVVFFAVSSYQQRNMLPDSGAQVAPFFHLPVHNSKQTFSSTQLKGQQTVIYFFAPWCSVCRLSMPNIDKLYQQGKVNAVAIALDYSSTQAVTEFVTDLELAMPVLMGNRTTAQHYKVTGFPTYYVIDEEMKITQRAIGYSTELGIRARL